MEKERKVTKQGAIIVFDRDVNASELNKLTKNFDGDIVILGKLFIDEDLHTNCNLYIIGDITCCAEKNIHVGGDLECYSEIGAYNIYVDGCFYCEGNISSDNIKVRESFWCKSRIEAYSGEITVIGDFECHGIKVRSLNVVGKTCMEGYICVIKFIKTGYCPKQEAL